MYNFLENFRGIIEPELVIGVAKGYDVVGHTQNLFNFPLVDYVMTQSVQKKQPPFVEHVLREDKVLHREGPEA